MSLNAIFLLLSSLEWFNLHFFMCPHPHILSKTSILKLKFDFSILKSKLHFVIEAIFQNGSLILNSKLHFEIEALFCNRSSISKSKLHFEVEAWFQNWSLILKSKLYFSIEAPFWNQNRSLILKSKLHVEIEAPFLDMAKCTDFWWKNADVGRTQGYLTWFILFLDLL